jgi:Kef-type K+ transport system membrane component KefB
VESEERRRPVPTATILWIEGGVMIALFATGFAAGPRTEVAALLFAGGILAAISLPLTLGLLWNDPRTSGATKWLALMLVIVQPVGLVIRGVYLYALHRSQTGLIVGVADYVSMWLLFLLGMGVSRRRNRRLSSGP